MKRTKLIAVFKKNPSEQLIKRARPEQNNISI